MDQDDLDIENKLRDCDFEIQNYVHALKAENLKAQQRIGKLQAEKVTLHSRITVLEEELRPVTGLAALFKENRDATDWFEKGYKLLMAGKSQEAKEALTKVVELLRTYSAQGPIREANNG